MPSTHDSALQPISCDESPWMFIAKCVMMIRRASRLKRDLRLDTHALALAMTLSSQISSVEDQLVTLCASHPEYRRF
jgi:hypothetical protein